MKREFNSTLSTLLQQWFDAHGKSDSIECHRIKELILDNLEKTLGASPGLRTSRDHAEVTFQSLLICFTQQALSEHTPVADQNLSK